MTTTRHTDDERFEDDAAVPAERPSDPRVERFLHGIERNQQAARRTRWIGLGVGAAIAAVAYLTAIGIVPVEAENLVISAGAVVAGLALGKS